jgi:hypothetical protein
MNPGLMTATAKLMEKTMRSDCLALRSTSFMAGGRRRQNRRQVNVPNFFARLFPRIPGNFLALGVIPSWNHVRLTVLATNLANE